MESARSKKRIVLEDKIAQHTQEMKRLKDNIVNQRENVRIIEKENAIRQDLVQKGISSQIVALESQRRLNEARGELKTSQNRVKEAEKQIAESRSRLESLDADLHEAALKELGQVETELAEIDETQSKMRLNLDRMEIRAPTRGLVKGLSTHTIGGVVGSGQLLMEIVPMRQELFVEAKIQPKDVGHIEIGQNVKVKVSSFDFARYGAVEGTITQISPATYSDEEGEVYYKGRISLTKHYVGDDPKRNFILPGMTVQADIKTGEKTVIAYLLKPIQIAREQAFSER